MEQARYTPLAPTGSLRAIALRSSRVGRWRDRWGKWISARLRTLRRLCCSVCGYRADGTSKDMALGSSGIVDLARQRHAPTSRRQTGALARAVPPASGWLPPHAPVLHPAGEHEGLGDVAGEALDEDARHEGHQDRVGVAVELGRIDAIGDSPKAHVERHSYAHPADAFSVSHLPLRDAVGQRRESLAAQARARLPPCASASGSSSSGASADARPHPPTMPGWRPSRPYAPPRPARVACRMAAEPQHINVLDGLQRRVA